MRHAQAKILVARKKKEKEGEGEWERGYNLISPQFSRNQIFARTGTLATQATNGLPPNTVFSNSLATAAVK